MFPLNCLRLVSCRGVGPHQPRAAAESTRFPGVLRMSWSQAGQDNRFINVTLIRQSGTASESKSLGSVSSQAFKWKDGRGGRKSQRGCCSGGVSSVFMRGINLCRFMVCKMLFSLGLFDEIGLSQGLE